jgi:hypothetical protein
MPTARFWISCHTKRDADLIEYLDSFDDPRQRSWFMKAALREVIQREEEAEMERFPYDRLKAIEELQEKIWHEIVALKKMRMAVAQEESKDPNEITEKDQAEIGKNLSKLWSHKE